MAIDQLIKKGEAAISEKDYLGAISIFNQALKEQPKTFLALLNRSIAFQRLKNYDSAKSDISEAFQIAEQRGKRADIGLCYFKLGLIFYSEKDYDTALKNLQKAKEFDCQEATLSTWLTKAEYDIKKTGKAVEKEKTQEKTDEKVAPTTSVPAPSSTSFETINKLAPLKVKIRDDWYQSSKEVIITIFAKNINKDVLIVNFTRNSVSISFPSGPNSEYKYNLDPLFADIVAEECEYKVYGTKLEIVLVKKDQIKWSSLEKPDDEDEIIPTMMTSSTTSASVYPTSSKKAVNWSNFKIADDEIDDVDKSENAFFEKLYKDTDDDTRRAMMKSYVESNGTVLTTNWSEAKDKTFESQPPEGMVAKKWNK